MVFTIIALIVALIVVVYLFLVTRPLPVLEPLKIPLPLETCHWCNDKITDNKRIERNCPNCNERVIFHAGCGCLRQLQPRCNGVYVEHPSGHKVSLKYPNLCASCGLGKELWNNRHCTPNVVGLSHRLSQFTKSDIEFLHNLHISLEDEPEKVSK